MTATLQDAWVQFKNERAVTLCPTSLVSDYRQVEKWINNCPLTDLNEGRQIMAWVLGQKPIKSSRRVAMYVKSLYKWAASEDIALLSKNPITTFKMPKPPQEEIDIIVIPQSETLIVLNALNSKTTRNGARWSHYAEFMLQTAMRTGEVRALKWEDIKENKVLVHGNYTLTHGYKNSTKTNRKRWVPLNIKTQEILDKTKKVDEYIFPWNRYAFQSYFYDRMSEIGRASCRERVS